MQRKRRSFIWSGVDVLHTDMNAFSLQLQMQKLCFDK